MLIFITTTMVETKELSMGTRESIVNQRDSEESGECSKAASKALVVPISTVKGDEGEQVKEKQHHAVLWLTSRAGTGSPRSSRSWSTSSYSWSTTTSVGLFHDMGDSGAVV